MNLGALVAVFVVATPLACLLDAWVLANCWNWFVPQTLGLRALSMLQAVALSLVVRAFVGSSHGVDLAQQEDETPSQQLGRILGHYFMVPLATIAVAWILHLLW